MLGEKLLREMPIFLDVCGKYLHGVVQITPPGSGVLKLLQHPFLL